MLPKNTNEILKIKMPAHSNWGGRHSLTGFFYSSLEALVNTPPVISKESMGDTMALALK